MLTRATNPRRPQAKYYILRGITVCERWKKFENFIADMGGSYFEGASLDRFHDVNGNYCPTNCRWATQEQQKMNRVNTRYVDYKGDKRTLQSLVDELGLNYFDVYNFCVRKRKTFAQYLDKNLA